MTEKSPSAIVLPFGKHKGSTVAELFERDPAYAEWILNQGWVAERFAELHAAILSRGATPDDSPEHNAIQVRFLDETFRVATLLAVDPGVFSKLHKKGSADALNIEESIKDRVAKEIRNSRQSLEVFQQMWEGDSTDWKVERIADLKKTIEENSQEISEQDERIEKIKNGNLIIKTSVAFEQRGIDVVIGASFNEISQSFAYAKLKVEIKPTMGDDFPSVMRQMERLGCDCLVVGTYTGRAVSEPDLRKMFSANGRSLIFVRDIEAELHNAKAQVFPHPEAAR